MQGDLGHVEAVELEDGAGAILGGDRVEAVLLEDGTVFPADLVCMAVGIRPETTGAAVERLDENEFRLVGREVERVVALNDVTTPEALAYIDERLERLGVNRMLTRAGVSDGDVVWIGEFSFEYRSDLGGSS